MDGLEVDMADDNMLDDLEFEKRIAELSDRGLQEFTARQVFETRKDVSTNTKRIVKLEKKSNKIIGITGGLGSLIGAAIVAILNYFTGRS